MYYLFLTQLNVYIINSQFFRSDKYKQLPAEAVLGNTLGIVCVFYCILVVYMITKPEFKRHPKLEYETLLK